MTTSHVQSSDTGDREGHEMIETKQETTEPVVGAGLAEALAATLAGTKWACSADELRPHN